jgi:hypothetical protein
MHDIHKLSRTLRIMDSANFLLFDF